MRTVLQFRLLPLAAALAATGAMAATGPTGSQVAPGHMFVTTSTSAPLATVAPPSSTSSGGGTTTTNQGTTNGTTSGNTSGATSGSTNTTSNLTNTNPANASTVIATQVTPSSATASGTPAAGQTSGVSISGTSSGDAFSGASRGNAPPVGVAATTVNANGTTTTVATNGALVTLPAGATQTQTANGAVVTTLPLNGALGIPIITDNSALVGGAVGINGELLSNPAANAGTSAGTNFTAFSDVTGAQTAAPQVGVATSALADPAVRKELRKRQNVRRNSQLLYSIAPRTNVDRSWQMPDDPISPALRPPA